MFTHVVLFKLKDNSKESMDKAHGILSSMEGQIPELKGLTVGKDELFTERSYDICLITTFESKEAMEAYQGHPFHVEEVLKNLKPLVEASKACDFTV